jgi:hypothetical protein
MKHAPPTEFGNDIDPLAAWLARAHALFILVEEGEVLLPFAIAELIEPLLVWIGEADHG